LAAKAGTFNMSLDLYYKHRPEMKSADLLQWQSYTALGWVIRKFSRSTVNHSGQVLDLALCKDLLDRMWTLEALEGGLDINLISSRLEGYKGRVWWHPLLAEYDEFRTRIRSLALMRATEYGHKSYDFGGLFKNALGRVSANAREYFCSEFVYLNCRDVGMPLGDWPREIAPRPGDMDRFKWWGTGALIFDSENE